MGRGSAGTLCLSTIREEDSKPLRDRNRFPKRDTRNNHCLPSDHDPNSFYNYPTVAAKPINLTFPSIRGPDKKVLQERRHRQQHCIPCSGQPCRARPWDNSKYRLTSSWIYPQRAANPAVPPTSTLASAKIVRHPEGRLAHRRRGDLQSSFGTFFFDDPCDDFVHVLDRQAQPLIPQFLVLVVHALDFATTKASEWGVR